MKSLNIILIMIVFLVAAPTFAKEQPVKNKLVIKSSPVTSLLVKSKSKLKNWIPEIPTGYQPINWVRARGIASFVKSPDGNGFSDYLTIIYLPYNRVTFLTSSTSRADWGKGSNPFNEETIKNWAFSKMTAEQAKAAVPGAKFIWDVPFHNITLPTTDLSLALKSFDKEGAYLTSGSRPSDDIAQQRRMLILDNKKAVGKIVDFDESIFTREGDQAVESFGPSVAPRGTSSSTARLFLGIKSEGKELIVYCSRAATLSEASNALVAAGVLPENQLQGDGGNSTMCGYNAPGQYFVEPGRMLPQIMGAIPLVGRGLTAIEGLNVRRGPGLRHLSIRRLPKNSALEIFEEKNGWLRISDDSAWVAAQYVKKKSE